MLRKIKTISLYILTFQSAFACSLEQLRSPREWSENYWDRYAAFIRPIAKEAVEREREMLIHKYNKAPENSEPRETRPYRLFQVLIQKPQERKEPLISEINIYWEALVKEAAQFYGFVAMNDFAENVIKSTVEEGMNIVRLLKNIPQKMIEGTDNFLRIFSIVAQCCDNPRDIQPAERMPLLKKLEKFYKFTYTCQSPEDDKLNLL